MRHAISWRSTWLTLSMLGWLGLGCSDPTGSSDLDEPREDAGMCPAEDAGSLLGTRLVVGSTFRETDSYEPICAGDLSTPDSVVEWVSPATGRVLVSTAGTFFNTILSAVTDCSADTVLACNLIADLNFAAPYSETRNGVTRPPGSQILLDVVAGQRFFFVVDGFDDGEILDRGRGSYTLNITPVQDPCATQALVPTLDLIDVPLPDTTGVADSFTSPCSPPGGSDIVVQWTSPITGDVTVDTLGSAFDTTLYYMTSCGGAALDCNDDCPVGSQCEGTSASTISFSAVKDQVYLFVIDGFDGGQSGPVVFSIFAS